MFITLSNFGNRLDLLEWNGGLKFWDAFELDGFNGF